MKLSDAELLKRLGAGESITSLCRAAGIDRPEFDQWWKATAAARVPNLAGSQAISALKSNVEIERDAHGIPHIYAQSDADLMFGFGYAMAQDRLFQLDYLRRKAHGRLAELLGPSGVENDLLARTVGLNRIAQVEVTRLPAETLAVLESYSAGINAAIASFGDNLPIEFALLDYTPEPWSPVDSMAIEVEFGWYLTGRFPVLCMPELAKRALGDGPLYREFLLGEADEETILPEQYYPAARTGAEPVGSNMGSGAANDPDAGVGSNNWVVDGSHTATGKPLLAGDPHIAIEAVSCWYEAHLSGGSFNTAGMAYVGIPAIMEGRNDRVAWAITNNISSIRDLYQERANPENPQLFQYNGKWEPARELTETIRVRGAADVTKTIRFTRNGPLVDEILPAPANKTGPVSLKWLGAYQGGWLTAMLAMDRAANVAGFLQSLEPWHVPTFCLVFADVDGGIGYQVTGRIPIRNQFERGYRHGWDPQHAWQGLIPFEAMPHVLNPERGWMATANHRVASDKYPYPLAGTWANAYRGRRIRQMIEAGSRFALSEFQQMQYDILNLRAVECVPGLVEVLAGADDSRVRAAAEKLRAWNCRSEHDQIGPLLFNVFFTRWSQTVADERFDPATAALLGKGSDGPAARLLSGDPHGWFARGDRKEKIIATFRAALELLTNKLGPDMDRWTWGQIHTLTLKHWLSSRGELGQLLDYGGGPVHGDYCTVCNTGIAPGWVSGLGAGYRMISDLASNPPGLWAIDGQSQSGNPGSPHYQNQHSDWLTGNYHFIPLTRAAVDVKQKQTLTP